MIERASCHFEHAGIIFSDHTDRLSDLLNKFADDVMAQLTGEPSADEIIVDEVKPFRFAERDGKVRDILQAMVAAG